MDAETEEITAAKFVLEGARAAFEHSPNGETYEKVKLAEAAVDAALDSWVSQSRAS